MPELMDDGYGSNAGIALTIEVGESRIVKCNLKSRRPFAACENRTDRCSTGV
jgi:hypothetical protein